MISLTSIVSSNKEIPTALPPNLVAVFVGGTSGVGLYTLNKFIAFARTPRVYIVGRSQQAADRIIADAKKINPGAELIFIKADISLIKSVDDVCRQITSKESSINLLFETQGVLAFKSVTSEGLPLASALAVYSRIRFILNLLPLLQKAQHLRRVVSVLGATNEGPIDLNDLPGKSLSLLAWRSHMSSIETILLQEAFRKAPEVSFIHAFPGSVKSGIMRGSEGVLLKVMGFVLNVFAFAQISPDETGERHLFLATSAMYGSPKGEGGVPLEAGFQLARGIDGKIGSGVYSVNNKDEPASKDVENLIAKFWEDGTADKVWKGINTELTRAAGGK